MARATAVMAAAVCGDPTDPKTTIGPLYGGRQAVEALLSLAADAAAKGQPTSHTIEATTTP